jgi:septin family protein
VFNYSHIKQDNLFEICWNICIVFSGDTGAGKSSFINLLLGQEVFPCSLLSNTSLICEIAYGAEPSATLYPQNGCFDARSKE